MTKNQIEPIHSRLRQIASASPEKHAIISGGERLTYEQFFNHSRQWASVFKKHNCKSVAVILTNGTQLPCLFVGATFVGVNVCILSPDWPAGQIEILLKRIRPDMIVDENTISEFLGSAEILPVQAEEFDIDAAFYTGFTSGSSSIPKGFVRDQRSWLESFLSDQEYFSFKEGDIFFVMGSLTHSLPLYGVIRGLYLGATVYLANGFHTRRLLQDCVDCTATVIYGTPTQYRALLDQANKDGVQLKSVRMTLSAGSKFPDKWLEDMGAVFSHAKHFEFFGTSELSYISAREIKGQDPQNLVGLPMPSVEVRILDEEGETVPAGEIGEIYVKSPFLFQGYVGDTGVATRIGCRFKDGFLSVGDRGHLDTEGQLYIDGRMDRLFQVSGRNIHPEAIEAALSEIAGIEAAMVFGVEDKLRENRIVAILKISAPLKLRNIRSQLRDTLPPYMIPTDYFICEDWPLTHSQKTDFPKLKKLYLANKLRRYL
ncbi:class I adenylate-forming enzyme family protein [Sneathiella glossodoripedis]|uniref:class I adenylate-forming enzyme family protein n=1 Tax=Sneathiella glossodoripedis TaxID=418853 RepID=UPI0004723762|nr:AMP-binding protein [Sneathiella glossodoripedis]